MCPPSSYECLTPPGKVEGSRSSHWVHRYTVTQTRLSGKCNILEKLNLMLTANEIMTFDCCCATHQQSPGATQPAGR